MPQVLVYSVEGRTAAQKKGLCEAITAAVVKHFAVSPEAVTVQIIESDKDSKSKAGKMFSEL